MIHLTVQSPRFEAALNANFKTTDEHLHKNDIRLEKMDVVFLQIEKDFDRLDRKIDRFGNTMMWVMGFGFVVLSTLVTVFGIINNH